MNMNTNTNTNVFVECQQTKAVLDKIRAIVGNPISSVPTATAPTAIEDAIRTILTGTTLGNMNDAANGTSGMSGVDPSLQLPQLQRIRSTVSPSGAYSIAPGAMPGITPSVASSVPSLNLQPSATLGVLPSVAPSVVPSVQQQSAINAQTAALYEAIRTIMQSKTSVSTTPATTPRESIPVTINLTGLASGNLSGTFTSGFEIKHDNIPAINADVRASSGYLRNKGLAEWKSVKQYNVPAYGVIVQRALAALCSHPKIHESLKKQKGTTPTYGYVKLTPTELQYVDTILMYIKAVTPVIPAALKLEQFLQAYKDCKPEDYATESAWIHFIERMSIPADWESKLAPEQVLQLFGCNDDIIALIKKEIAQDNKDSSDAVTRVFGALSSAVAGYRCSSGESDLVNLVFAMMNEPLNNSLTEYEVARVIYRFVSHLDIWIPDVHIHDGKSDSQICHAVISAFNPRVKSILQLPEKGFEVYGQMFSMKPNTDNLYDKDVIADEMPIHV
jgi:hypothetical protein